MTIPCKCIKSQTRQLIDGLGLDDQDATMTSHPSGCIKHKIRKLLGDLGIDLDATPSVHQMKTRKARGDRWLRTKALAEPIVRPRPRPKSPPAIARGGYGRVPSRLEYLSRPKKDYSEDLYATASDESVRNRNANVGISERLLRLSEPRREIPEEIVKRTCFESREQWAAHAKKLETFAAHRRELQSPLEPVRKKVTLEKLLPRLVKLSRPAKRPPNNNERTDEEIFTVKATTLQYVASDRIEKLSMPKKVTAEQLEDLNYDPRKRYKRAKHYIPSDRTKELSKPIHRIPPKSEEVKVDAFKVNRKALKARCSARLKRLSTPKKRD